MSMTQTTRKAAETRDLDADLAICEAATPGPWLPNDDWRYTNDLVWGPDGPGHGAIAETKIYTDRYIKNARFIAAARQGWPYAIRRAQEAEREVDRLRNEIDMLQEQLRQHRR